MFRLIPQSCNALRILVLCLAAAGPLLAATSESEAPELPPEVKSRYLAASRLPGEYNFLGRGDGDVLIGRLILPENTPVASRTTLMKDNSFITAVFPGRTLTFYAHGYDPLIVDRGKEVAPSVLDVGEKAFVAASPQRLRTVSGSVRFAKPAAAGHDSVSVALGINNLAYLYSGAGHRGGKPSVSVLTKTVRAGERFNFGGLSRIPYDLTFSAPGYITVKRTIDPKASGAIALDVVTISPALKLTFTYVAQLDLASSADYSDLKPEQQTIVCDGESRFVYSHERDALRNQFFLRLKPTDRGVEASSVFRPADFHDLGPGNLSDVLRSRDWHKRIPKANNSGEQLLQPGRVYLFRNRSRDTNCLFAVGS